VVFSYIYYVHKSPIRTIRVITKLPNSEESYKRKVKTHKYINRQNQSTIIVICIFIKMQLIYKPVNI